MLAELARDAEAEAGANLHAVLAAFAEHYRTKVTVEGMPLEKWGDRSFGHRVHVAVER
jgi:hypothetical protein